MTEEVEFSSNLQVDLIDSMGSDRSVLAAMLVSTQGEESRKQLDEATSSPEAMRGRINFLVKNRHGSCAEHNAMTFFVKAPIAVFREWHRHRIQMFNEASGRYSKMPAEFYVPPPERPLVQVGKPGAYTFVPGTEDQYARTIQNMQSTFRQEYKTYERMLEDNVAKEVARGVLGVYLYSSMYVTMNARSCMAFLSLRTQYEDSTFPSFPMWEIARCADQVEAHFARLFPITREAFVKNGRVSP